MSNERRNPEELLAQAEEEERQQKSGKLKVFFGAAPGVGKTYAMLNEAIAKRQAGLDVVVGVVETHGRKDIEELLSAFEIIPRYSVNYRSKELLEFNLNTAIERKPALIIVDEMAHTNITGATHTKRWQDIAELLDRGIDVYTTLNVQHVESLNDVIKQITGVNVQETVPDSILEKAQSIELVDLPPDDLIKRMQEGKVYIPEQAELAMQHFFRKANLTALRELALRYTADRVNLQVLTERRGMSERRIWPTNERILVCVNQSSFSIKLIRTARRMATSMQTEWLAVFVDSPGANLTDKERQNAIENLRHAELLGAETAILTGYDRVKEIMDYSQMHNVTKIVIGKKVRPRWQTFFVRSMSDEIVRSSNEIDVYIITGEQGDFKSTALQNTTRMTIPWTEYVIALITACVCTLINYPLYPFITLSNTILIYLLGVVFMAARGRSGPAILTSIVSLIIYAYLFVPIKFSFTMTNAQYILTFAVLIIITQIIIHLTVITKKQTEITRLQERRTNNLYQLSRELASHRGTEQLLKITAKNIAEVFDCEIMILLPGASGHLVAHSMDGETAEIDVKDRSIAQWSYDLGQSAGLGTNTLSFSNALYYPVKDSRNKIAVLRIKPKKPDIFLVPEQLHLLETFIHQAMLSIEVDILQEEVRRSQLEIEVKGLRTILLDSISHEIHVPLAEIQKTIKLLLVDLEKANMLDSTRTILQYSMQLNHLIDHFVQTLQIEAGLIDLNKEKITVEKIIAIVLNKLHKYDSHKKILLQIDNDIPTLPCDKLLLVRALVNLIENIMKHSTVENALIISATRRDNIAEFCIANQDSGIDAEEIRHVFDPEYRLQTLSKMAGSSLGLLICRSIIELHGGKIWLEQRPGIGSVIKLTLPLT